MNTEPKKSRLAHVPSILGGTAALIAAVTTLYVNLRSDPQLATEPAPQVSAAPANVASMAPAVVSNEPRRMLLRLDRVQVNDDGSAGSTDWTFEVSVDGDPLFSVPMPSLNDKPGESLARPKDREQASAEVELPANKNVPLSVKGWKKDGWLPGSSAEVSGKAWLASGFGKTTVTLKTEKPKGPQFVLYFSATPAK